MFCRKILLVLVFMICISFSVFAERINPGDLEYKGAFRLPNGPEWEYNGYALTYYPKGDPYGNVDGYTGSLLSWGMIIIKWSLK